MAAFESISGSGLLCALTKCFCEQTILRKKCVRRKQKRCGGGGYTRQMTAMNEINGEREGSNEHEMVLGVEDEEIEGRKEGKKALGGRILIFINSIFGGFFRCCR